jgi:hypothetical protein
MSYTSDIPPELFYILYNRDRELEFTFQCPRCQDTTEVTFLSRLLDLEFSYEFHCLSPRCTGEGERPGYYFEFSLKSGISYSSLLGENDRPLHPHDEKNIYGEDKHLFTKIIE